MIILIDVTDRRDKFFDASYKVLQGASQKIFDGYILAGAVLDIYYIIRKSTGDTQKARQTIKDITQLAGVCDTKASDVSVALTLDMPDFEDAIVAAAAKREKADCIITRNTRDFINSPVPALTPDEFISKLSS